MTWSEFQKKVWLAEKKCYQWHGIPQIWHTASVYRDHILVTKIHTCSCLISNSHANAEHAKASLHLCKETLFKDFDCVFWQFYRSPRYKCIYQSWFFHRGFSWNLGEFDIWFRCKSPGKKIVSFTIIMSRVNCYQFLCDACINNKFYFSFFTAD